MQNSTGIFTDQVIQLHTQQLKVHTNSLLSAHKLCAPGRDLLQLDERNLSHLISKLQCRDLAVQCVKRARQSCIRVFQIKQRDIQHLGAGNDLFLQTDKLLFHALVILLQLSVFHVLKLLVQCIVLRLQLHIL